MPLTTLSGRPKFTATTKVIKMPYKGTQPNHYVTDSNNHTKTVSDTGQAMSDSTKKSMANEINKIVTESKIKAKQESDAAKAPKSNWVTMIGVKRK